MTKLLLSLVLFQMGLLVSSQMLSNGMWSLISIGKCPNEDEIKNKLVTVEVVKHKMNRTHDGINAKIITKVDITDKFAMLIDICKYVDGGCKQYQIISDESMARFIYKYAKNNLEAALTLAKIDPPDFPLSEGEYEVENFVMDYCELPLNCPVGKYDALAYIIQNGEKVGCVKVVAEFEEGTFCEE